MERSRRWRSRARTRGVGAGVVQAFAAASQMALLYPPGVDEWVRLELEGRNGNGRPRQEPRR
jgi:hypothetical protein